MIGQLVFALTLLMVTSSEDDHDHGHGESAFEWAGVFETPEDYYTWTAQKIEKDGSIAYADPAMKLAAIPVHAAAEENLHRVESEGSHALEMNCIELQSGGVIYPEKNQCYTLVFDQNMWQSLYTVQTKGTAAVAFFTEHFPTEFENDAHYLKDDHGDDIEPVAELPEEETASTVAKDEDTPWGAAIGASLIVNVITLVGVILAIPFVRRGVEANSLAAHAILSGFAAGAILACAFFLLLFEATHLVAEGWDEEVDVLWRWGTMILAGMLLPGLFHLAADFVPAAANPPVIEVDVVPVSKEGAELKQPTFSEKVRLFVGVNLGDFFHNLCDGIFLGFAFKGCGSSFGWRVLLGTVLHEIPQELADYALLTGPQCMLSPLIALACNFVSGLGVVLGAVIVLANDVGNEHTGLLLAFGGGQYLYIGAVECMPKIYDKALDNRKGVRIASIAMFILGAILIGLVLLDHEHCVPPTPAGAPKPKGHHH